MLVQVLVFISKYWLSYMYFFVMLIQIPSSQTPNKIHNKKRSASPAFDLQSSMTVLPVSMMVTIGIGVSIRVRHPVLSSFSHSVVGPHVLRNSSHRKI